jgi:hypothetical protein
LLLSLRAAVNIVLFIVILPTIAALALRKVGITIKDLLIAKGSIIFLGLGALVVFLSASPAAMIIGK